ncbi:MAG: TonB-dependent receptor, partial [Rhizomicrobium sp.]
NAAGRVTDYSTSGMVETWKLGATSQINDDIRLRSTYSYDIRAPNLGELFSTVTASGTYLLPNGTTNPNAFIIEGGNPNLKPEAATTWEAGVVLTPHWVEGLSMSFDWYSIDLKGYISSPPEKLEAQLCSEGNQSFCNDFVVVGGTQHILDVYQNNGYLTTSGLDFAADYAFPLYAGSMALHLVGNYNDEETEEAFDQPAFDAAGSMGGNSEFGGVPKVHVNLSATYTQGPWMGMVQTRFIGAGTLNAPWNFGGPCQTVGGVSEGFCVADNNVSPIAYLDLRTSYNWNQNLQFYVSVDNVLDTPPPLVISTYNLTTTDSLDTNTSQYDTLGRVIHAGIRFNF